MTYLVEEYLKKMKRDRKPFTKTQIETVKAYDKKCDFAGIKDSTRNVNIQRFFQFLSAVDKEFKEVNEQDTEDFLQKMKDRNLEGYPIEICLNYVLHVLRIA